MKIAILAHLHHVIAEPFPGGTEMHTAVVANELVRRGHDVTLFAKAGSDTAAKLEPLVPSDFTFGAAWGSDGRDHSDEILAEVVGKAIATIRSDAYDVVFNNSLGPLPYTELAGVAMLTVLHTPPSLEKVNIVITRSDWHPDRRHRYVSVSEFNSRSWRTLLPKVDCIPNGIQLDQWADAATVEPGLAVWSARITPEKGLERAIDAVRRVGMRLEFSGPVANREYFDSVITPLLGDDVIHRGHIKHAGLAAQLSRGEVFVSSSIWAEPFGLALVEAMACGTPVAAFPKGAAAEVVNAHGGVVARDCSPTALAEAIQQARTMDRQLVRGSAQRYDAHTMIDRYESAMRELVR